MMQTTVSPAMQIVIDHFRVLGPRWGLGANTCAAHALLYLVGRPMSETDVAQCLHLDAASVRAAIDDLLGWRMAQKSVKGLVGASGEPWDLLFAALEERRRREIEPALRMLAAAAKKAQSDGTPLRASQRIRSLHELVRDISTIGSRVGQLPPRAMARLVGLGGRIFRMFGPIAR